MVDQRKMPEIERIIGSAEEEKRILGSERDAAHRGVVDVFVRRSHSAEFTPFHGVVGTGETDEGTLVGRNEQDRFGIADRPTVHAFYGLRDGTTTTDQLIH